MKLFNKKCIAVVFAVLAIIVSAVPAPNEESDGKENSPVQQVSETPITQPELMTVSKPDEITTNSAEVVNDSDTDSSDKENLLDSDQTDDSETDEAVNEAGAVWWVVGSVLALIVAGGLVYYFVFYKKSQTPK